MDVRPIKGQVDDLLNEIRIRSERNERVLVTTLTKRMAEDLSAYLGDNGVKCKWLHSELDAFERVELLRDLREGHFDVLVGVNLLREGLDLPDGEGKITQDAMDDEHKPLLKKVRNVLKDRVETVHVSSRLVSSPACVVAGENELNPSLRRMLEASGQELPESKPILEVNVGHPLLERLSAETDEERAAIEQETGYFLRLVDIPVSFKSKWMPENFYGYMLVQ